MPTTKANIRAAPIRLTAAALTGTTGKEIPAAAVTEQVKALSKNVGYDTEDALRVNPETGEVMESLN